MDFLPPTRIAKISYRLIIGGFVFAWLFSGWPHIWHNPGIPPQVKLAQAATFADDTQSDFDAGAYSNTVWDTNHVELSSGQTVGTFTSQVFDGGYAVNWSQIAWSETLTSVDKLLLVDSTADVFKSIDDGASWSLVKDDYTGADANNATDMVRDSNENIFILFNQSVWKSTDAGASWTKVHDDYNGGEGQNGQRIAVDGDDNLYVVEADEDVWQSTNGGVSWTKVGNTGGANTQGFVGIDTTLYVVDSTADIWRSTDSGVNWTLIRDDYTGADANNATYMVADSDGNLVILFNQTVWRSTDSGVNWTKVHDDYNGSEGQSGIFLARNSLDELFIAEGDDDIWQSTDDGTNWTKLGNFGGGNVKGLVYVGVSTDITLSVRSGSTNPPTGSFSGALTNPSGADPNVSDARYFQYRAAFTTEDSGVTPELSSVTVTYPDPDTTAPTVPGLPRATIGTDATSQDWSWTASTDAGSGVKHYSWRVDGGPSGTSTSPTITTNLAEGNHTFYVKTEDNAGNQSAETLSVLAVLTSSVNDVAVDCSVPLTQVVVVDGVSNPSLDLSSIVVSEEDLLVANLNCEIVIKTLLSSSAVTVTIPEGTTIKGLATLWSKAIIPPISTAPDTALLPTDSQVALAIKIGDDNALLAITKGTRILVEGQAGKKAGHISGNTFTEITSSCADDSQATGDALAENTSCKIDSGSDLVVWTKHFSEFVSYTIQDSSSGGGGGGIPVAWNSPPKPPAGEFRVLINNGAETTSTSNVVLNLQGGPDTARMAISSFSDFRDASQEEYIASKAWNLCWENAMLQIPLTCPAGAYTVYVKYYTPWGATSDVVSDVIILGSRPTPPEYGLKEGMTIAATDSHDPDIYIINEVGFKRLFLNPIIFSFYGHLGGFEYVETISDTTRDAFETSGLFRNCQVADPKVYALEVTGEDTGTLHWINMTGDQATAEDSEFFQKVFCINTSEFNWYTQNNQVFGPDYTSVHQVPSYRR